MSVITGKGVLRGMFVATTSSGTIILYDGISSTGTAITGTITPTAGAFYDLGNIQVSAGAYVRVGGTSIDATFFVKSTND